MLQYILIFFIMWINLETLTTEELNEERNIVDRIAHERDWVSQTMQTKIEALKMLEKIDSILNERGSKDDKKF